ncbi:MAG: hypothetical protein RPU34_09420 [Candidatus Sedimenticola sp. (ex Thyasira tokunagai)]
MSKFSTGVDEAERSAFVGSSKMKTNKGTAKACLFRLYSSDEAIIEAMVERGIAAGVRPAPSKTAIVRAALLAMEALGDTQYLDAIEGRHPLITDD